LPCHKLLDPLDGSIGHSAHTPLSRLKSRDLTAGERLLPHSETKKVRWPGHRDIVLLHSPDALTFVELVQSTAGPIAQTNKMADARKINFRQQFQHDLSRPVSSAKITRFAATPNHPYKSRHPVPSRGALAIVTNVGAGCGGRGSVGRVVVFAGRALGS